MHKALAKAWRDLGHGGQKPYFAEYDRNRERYKEEVAGLNNSRGVDRAATPTSHGKRGPRTVSAASSVGPTPAEPEATSPPESVNEDMEDAPASSSGGFTAVNR